MRVLEYFHKYLYRQEFHLCTDHSALTWLMSFKNLEGQTTCWIQHLQEYNFTSEHHRGRKHNSANSLSQQPCQVYLLPQNRGVGRHQAGTSYCSCSCTSWFPAVWEQNTWTTRT
jgi:hypothetical protein